MKTILAPIDFSVGSTRVIDEAIVLARAVEARIIVLHVVQLLTVAAPEVGTRTSAEFITFASKAATARLLALQRRLAGQSITVETRCVVASPGPAIVEEAERQHADFVVIGSHGHGALHELVIGSTTSRVLKHAPCPVIVVPLAGVGRRKRPSPGRRAARRR